MMMNAEMLARVRASHPALRGVTNENLTTYLPFVVAHLLGIETQRKDSVLEDPVIAKVAGDVGNILHRFGNTNHADTEKFVVVCAYLVEQVLRTRHPSIHQIVQIGSTMNTQAYWMKELEDCNVYQVHSNPAMIREMQQRLDLHNIKAIARENHVISVDVRDDSWQDRLLASGFDPSQPTLWIVGGVVAHMSQEQGAHLLALIDELSSPFSQIYADMCSGHKFDIKIAGTDEIVLKPGAHELYGDDANVFRSIASWSVELLARRDSAFQYYGTMWDPQSAALDRLRNVDPALAFLGPFYMVRFTIESP